MKFENITGNEDEPTFSKDVKVIGNRPKPFTELKNNDFEIANARAVKIIIYF